MKSFVYTFVFLLIFEGCNAFNPYLESLSIKYSSSTHGSLSHCTNINELRNIMKNAPLCQEKSVHIDSIYFNIYELKNIGFKPNTDTILFKMKEKIQDLYYVDENKIFKLSNNTKIVSECIRNFNVYEMDPDRKINGIVFNSQKNNKLKSIYE